MLRTPGDASRITLAELKGLAAMLRDQGYSNRAIRQILRWYQLEKSHVLDAEG